jgi:hypothetical protein
MTIRLATLVVAALLAFPAGSASQSPPLPASEAELVETVRTALAKGDQQMFDALVNWEGAGVIKQRIVRFQIRHEFGRPIRKIELEPLPEGSLDKVAERGTLRVNMPVTHRLRVEFDEPPRPDGNPAADVFLIGQQEGVYRIALVVRAARPRDND